MKYFIMLIITLVMGCTIPDAVIINNPDPIETWYEQTWEFGDPNTLQRLSDGSVWSAGTVKVLSQESTEIYWDRTSDGLDPTGSSSVRITFNPTGTCCGVQIFLPNSDSRLEQEIWHEQWIKFDPDWDVSELTNCSSDLIPYNGHKTIWWYSNVSNTWRHEFLIGMKGNELLLINPLGDDDGLTNVQIDEKTQVWDGRWHRWRFYLKRPDINTQGWYTLWFDDQILHDGPENPTTGQEPPYWDNVQPHWSSIQLSRNMRCPPTKSQSMWFGRTTIFSKNPNWR